jgi:septal ring factor EnvC (AmiA/AmiB activator)
LSQALDEASTRAAHAIELEKELREHRDQLAEARRQLAESDGIRQSLQSQLSDAERRIIEVQEREIQVWHRNDELRTRLDRFEGHPLLATALRGRRRLKRLIHAVGEGLAAERNGTH